MEESISRRGFIAGSAAAAALGTMGVAAGMPAFASEQASDFDLGKFNAWLEDHHNFGASSGSFLPGEENAPTDDELVQILKIANSYQWCHLLTAPHFVVIRDPEEQAAITPLMGTTAEDATGTVTVLMLADGCKDQDHHKDAYNSRHDDVHYWQMYYALIELGQAQAYLTLAARSLGYRVRNYGAVSVPNISYANGMGDQEAIAEWACGGDWDMIRDENWDISKYSQPKEGGEPFMHHVYANDLDVELDGNLTLVYAVKIGTVDEDALDTSVTSFGPSTGFTDHIQDCTLQQYNFDFWDTGVRGMDFYEEDPRFTEAKEAEAAEAADGAAEDSAEGDK